MAETILVVDDDIDLLELTSQALEAYGFTVFTATTGEEALEVFGQLAPDLVILDIMMPGLDGREVCLRLRRISAVPIIFLTGLDSVDSIVKGLVEGADDYLVKPFMNAELIARVNALLRRARMAHEKPDVLKFNDGELVINRAEQKVFARGEEVSLSPIEYNLLLFMADRAGRVLPARLIYDAVWGPWAGTQKANVKWYIWSLRKKIEADPKDPKFILSERNRGYRFSPR